MQDQERESFRQEVFNMRKVVLFAAIGVIVIFALLQLVPYGRDHSNPAVVTEPQWDSLQTRELAARACFDCHSNETHWPWYSNVAPVSWLVQRDVQEGRRRLNFSEWNQPQRATNEVGEVINEGEMPPWFYLPLHASARLTPAEKQALVAGLEKTLSGGR
jgi:mono/diheme cytochrome c family protein